MEWTYVIGIRVPRVLGGCRGPLQPGVGCTKGNNDRELILSVLGRLHVKRTIGESISVMFSWIVRMPICVTRYRP